MCVVERKKKSNGEEKFVDWCVDEREGVGIRGG